jgi:hypothetical protein
MDDDGITRRVIPNKWLMERIKEHTEADDATVRDHVRAIHTAVFDLARTVASARQEMRRYVNHANPNATLGFFPFGDTPNQITNQYFNSGTDTSGITHQLEQTHPEGTVHATLHKRCIAFAHD